MNFQIAKTFSWKPRWDTTAAVTQTAKWYGCFLNQRDVVQLTKKQIALFAYHLSFYHPVTKKLMVFEQMPKGHIWNQFF